MGRGSAAAGGRGLLANARHELLVKVAVGGTSTVFVGRERGGTDLVAIKRMHPYLASDESARTQMLREASIAGRVRHDHLVHIHGAEQSGDELLLIMDYVEGGSLADLLAATSLPLGVGLRIVLDAASGLAALHEVADPETGRRLEFVHRDISPQNILVGVDGRARLGDFGLVKRTDVSTTHTTVVRGKVAYMAPEQIEGQRARQAADIYALGVVLWEVVSGDRLFRGGNDADTMRRVLVGAVPSLADRGHPAALDDVVRRCLARDPQTRFGSVEELEKAIVEAAAAIALASPSEIAALVDDALGETLRRRRDTIAASANAETTATGDVDIDAILASGRANAGLSTAPLPTARAAGFVEGDTLPFSDTPVSQAREAIEEEETLATGPPPAPSPPHSRASAPTPAPTSRSSSSRTTVIAIVAALAGASVSWLVARSSMTDAEPSGAIVAPTATPADATPAATEPAPTPLEAATKIAPDEAGSDDAEVDDAEADDAEADDAEVDDATAATQPTAPAPPRPVVARPRPTRKSSPKVPAKKVKTEDDDVLVPDNPYR